MLLSLILSILLALCQSVFAEPVGAGAQTQLTCDLPATDANANVVIARLKCVITALQDDQVRTTQSEVQYRAEALLNKAYLDQANNQVGALRAALSKTQAALQAAQDAQQKAQARIPKLEKELRYWRSEPGCSR